MSTSFVAESVVEMFWTGGFDSTFRLCELVLMHRKKVQPIYVMSPSRVSMEMELRAMAEIRQELMRRVGSDLLLRTVFRLQLDYPRDEEIAQLYQSLVNRGLHVGSQYEWLARICKAHNQSGVELCLTRFDDTPALYQYLFEESLLEEAPTVRLHKPGAALFKYYAFPTLTRSKREMLEIAVEQGFEDIVRRVWICHRPVLGKPCGWCRPCRLQLKEGTLPKASLTDRLIGLGYNGVRKVHSSYMRRRFGVEM